MKKFLLSCAAAGALIALAGCSALEVTDSASFNGQKVVPDGSKKDAPVALVSTNCYGLYLFTIPLINGNPEVFGTPTVLVDSSNSQTQVNLITAKAKALNCTRVVDLTTTNSSVGFIFYIKSSSGSGTVLR